MKGKTRRRGEPVMMLALLLASYVGMRAAAWENPLRIIPAISERLPSLLADSAETDDAIAGQMGPTPAIASNATWRYAIGSDAASDIVPASYGAQSTPRALSPAVAPMAHFSATPHHIIARHHLLLMSGLSQTPVPPTVAALSVPAAAPVAVEPSSKPDRWSFDSWLFLRQGTPSVAVNGVRPSSYGASQAGAVLRYRLAPRNNHRPTAYVRATQTLDRVAGAQRESEAAVGMAARPIAKLPVSAHAELRASRTASGTELRPAAFVVSEFPPLDLPFGAKGEAYAQAGYVGGDFATPFADGQARVTREVASFKLGTVSVGAAVWGGAQKGAARVDIGPSASVDFRIGPTNGRAQIDYRKQVAGDADPGDGVAFTLSTGF